MTHPLLTINWKRYLLVTGAVILIGLVWVFLISYKTQDADCRECVYEISRR